MTISGALSNAISGLRAAGRGAEVVSSNISNALTPGYGRRLLSLSAATIGDSGGVRVDGIIRIVDASLASDRRLAGAEQVNAQGAADFLAGIERLLGTPDNPASLSARLSGFESALITASSRPDATERLSASVAQAKDLVDAITSASSGIQDARTLADQTISSQVEQLNSGLQQIVDLNQQITALQVQGGNVAGLQDLRQQVIDDIGVLVPIREVPRDNGQIALYSVGGAVLVDGTAATIGFDRSNVVTPYMSVEAGTLSGLTINDTPVRTSSEKGALRGGAIGAQFAIRDELGVEAQVQVDAIARDLISRFQDLAVDPTIVPGGAGLFTDSGGSFDPINERGLASRLTLNASVDPNQGGSVWRMRDGVNAMAPGAIGDATLLQNLGAALSTAVVPGSGGFGGSAFTSSGLVAAVTSQMGSDRTVAEQKLSFAAARFSELTERQLADGVDTDQEIQRLMTLEQAYAANARVIEAVDEMMQTIIRM
ncbi:Flagellar hook-associated protein FlgK [Sulfitobacter noctilucae]|uniref:flagellar hook-associated protein FlgK n=1 Tax=Sulfitobacter noctilucae TaxID=1342302 RepID=UPI00046888C0|nr:flagellar hook-associated protein FlgK [Sulfitobacter noctilucae]KIN75400.1 Flagellar hook-associated protein FlgK [Sulfitobacter noctilucae]